MTAADPRADPSARTGRTEPAHLVTFGETMGLVSSLDVGILDYARHVGLGIGGAESNVAIGVARLGGRAMWIGRVGPDATGDLIERRIATEGVNTVAIRDDRYTGIMVKHRRFGTTVTVDYHRAGSAGSRLRSDDLPADVISRARLLHVTGITPALSHSARTATFTAVRLAHEAGIPVSVDVNFRRKLWPPDEAAPVLRQLVRDADVVFAGPDEAALVTKSPQGLTSEQLARALHDLGPTQAIIKDGSRGCTALIADELYDMAALKVTAIDPVGAGDAFVAGYLSELMLGATPAQRLTTAISAGAFAVTIPGDCEGLPTRSDLRLFIRTRQEADDVQR